MTPSLAARHVALTGPSRAVAPFVLGVVLVLALGRASFVVAADPSGSPSPAAPDCGEPFQAWIDSQLPPDIPAGRHIPIGVTVWDCSGGALRPVDGAEVRVHPKTGKAKPTTFPARSDWPGHLTTTIEIPKGGLGEIEVGAAGQVCHDDGTCEDGFFPFATGGVGPPPAAPRGLLVDAVIAPLNDRIVTDQPFTVEISLEPKADWGPDALALPDLIVLEADLVRGNASWGADAERSAGSSGPYTATLSVDQAGNYVLRAGVPTDDGPAVFVEGSSTRILVERGDGTATATATPATPSTSEEAPGTGSGPPFLPIAAGLAVILAAGLVIRRVFADL